MIFSFGILVQIILSASQDLKNKNCIDSLLYSLTSDSEVFNSLESSSYTRIRESYENLPGRIKGGPEDIDKVLNRVESDKR